MSLGLNKATAALFNGPAAKLSADQLARLNTASALPPEYPGWMITVQARDRLEAISQEKRFAKVT
jgi:hypothetical protein